jgi:biopolymer transport protein ExbD
MRTSVPVVVAAVLLGVVLASAPAAAQAVKVDIPFAFTVSEKSAPAGSYEVELQGSDAVVLRSTTAASTQFLLPVVTRLAPGSESKSRLVFDRVGTVATLSEVWLSGRDGYLVGMTKAAHTHQSVPVGGK